MKEAKTMKEFYFTITLIGAGLNAADAWDDVCQGFIDKEHALDEDDIVKVVDIHNKEAQGSHFLDMDRELRRQLAVDRLLKTQTRG